MSDYKRFLRDLYWLRAGNFLTHTGKNWYVLLTPFQDNVGDEITLEIHVDHKHHRVFVTDSGYTRFTWDGLLTNKEFSDIIKIACPICQNHITYGSVNSTHPEEIFVTPAYNSFGKGVSYLIQYLLSVYALCTQYYHKKEV